MAAMVSLSYFLNAFLILYFEEHTLSLQGTYGKVLPPVLIVVNTKPFYLQSWGLKEAVACLGNGYSTPWMTLIKSNQYSQEGGEKKEGEGRRGRKQRRRGERGEVRRKREEEQGRGSGKGQRI